MIIPQLLFMLLPGTSYFKKTEEDFFMGRKIKKLTLVSITLTIMLGSIISCGYSQSPLDDKTLKKVLKEKAGLDLKDKLNIKSFESQQSAGADYFERYEIELSQNQLSQVLISIKSSDKIGWKKIERGYTLLTPKPSMNTNASVETYYTFTLDITDNSLEVQIAHE